jgi:hypothetical protein
MPIKKEANLNGVRFIVHKFTKRPRPKKADVAILPAFAEFGCETLIPLYCLPILMKGKCAGKYMVVMGWYGREFLYKHLVDEYWELGEEHQNLREYCRAFHHTSKTLKKVERQASEIGEVLGDGELANITCFPRLEQCHVVFPNGSCPGSISRMQDKQFCMKCGYSYPAEGLFSNCEAAKKRAVWLPSPSDDKMQRARDTLPPNAVGITARGRKCYGRNLTPEFYERLIWLLEDMGYNPVWLGEKVTTLPCPVSRIFDFSRHPDARDLEQTMAYVANMRFTIQFWTASTRLAGYMGTPFLLFESPSQIWGTENYWCCQVPGHEGFRLHLTSKGPKKLVIAHFKNVVENHTKTMKVVEAAVQDMQKGDYSTTISPLVEDELTVRDMKRHQKLITWF